MGETEARTVEIRCQPGPQESFLSTDADIAIYGGAAGGGKTFALLLEPLRHIHNPKFGAVIFRRTSPEIRNEGGMWDESKNIYPLVGGFPRETTLEWLFPRGSKIRFAHLQYEQDLEAWKGSQITLIGFDQLETFSEKQFWYLLSRNRSTCGVRPYIRATVNPDPDSFVAKLIEWWVDQDTGYPITERSGVVRWFVRMDEQLHWADTPEELIAQFGKEAAPKSFTFIAASVYDNRILLDKNPEYLANLLALPLVDRERLLKGNWKVRPEAGKLFNRAWFEIVDAVPAGGREIRFWDLAASEKKSVKDDPDFTASNRMKEVNGIIYILDATADRLTPTQADSAMKNTALQDGRGVAVRWEEEGGASGKRDTAHLIKLLAGFDCGGIRPEGDKIVRAKPLAAQAEAGNVKLLRGAWNERWLNHMHGQPEAAHDDEMDAASGAYNYLTSVVILTAA